MKVLLILIFAFAMGCGQLEETEYKSSRKGKSKFYADQNSGENQNPTQDSEDSLPNPEQNVDETQDTEDQPTQPDIPNTPEEPENPDLPEEPGEWHSLFFTGDNSIWAFDNAREELSGMFMNYGLQEENMRQLTMMNSLINQGMRKTSHISIRDSLQSMTIADNDYCLVHMTSHGSRSGFYLTGQNQLTPKQFDQMLDDSCGKRPTVVLVSACYSGIFSDSQDMQQDNRIILTAARKDRTSFGCSPENEFTYWDGCLIDLLPSSSSWQNLHANILQCIERKESAGNFKRSHPQLFVGKNMMDIPYPMADDN